MLQLIKKEKFYATGTPDIINELAIYEEVDQVYLIMANSNGKISGVVRYNINEAMALLSEWIADAKAYYQFSEKSYYTRTVLPFSEPQQPKTENLKSTCENILECLNKIAELELNVGNAIKTAAYWKGNEADYFGNYQHNMDNVERFKEMILLQKKQIENLKKQI